MSIATQTLSAARAIVIIIAVGIAASIGFVFAVYVSLRSSEVKVPDIVGKDRYAAENELTSAGLNFRVRAVRPSNQVKADSILFQLPRAGEVVKAGQTVAVDVSRTAKEGEASETISHEANSNSNKASENGNKSESATDNLNENKAKPTRNANNTNGNATANANANATPGNRNANANATIGNRNANANRPRPNVNANSETPEANSNANRSPNNNRVPETSNQNVNRPSPNANRPRVLPQPTPPR